MKKVIIIGAGAQARETFQIFADNGNTDAVEGFLVTTESEHPSLRSKTVFSKSRLKNKANNNQYIIAIGNSYFRKNLVKKFSNLNLDYINIIHNSVNLGLYVEIGLGSTIAAGCILLCDIKIGEHVLINTGSIISHDVHIGNFTTISPGVTIGGHVEIGEATWIGIGSTIKDNIKIGSGSFIGAGSVVVEDIPDNVLAYGVPCKPIKKIFDSDWRKII